MTNSATISTLKAAAAATGRIFGAAIAAQHLSEPLYASTAAAQFSGLTPENEMKWEATEPEPGVFAFGPADTLVSFAESYGMKIRGHTLVFHGQLPAWVGEIAGEGELLAAMQRHIQGVMGHYKGKIAYWDVVNEAFEDDGTRRASLFQTQIGTSYIADAFRTAREADPAAILYYNDYGAEEINPKSTAIYEMVRDFKASGVPIDGVGFQTHLTVGDRLATFQENLQRFADLGVEIQVTELDEKASHATLAQEAADFAKVVRACLAIPRCTSITVWGVTDPYSWLGAPAEGLLFDGEYQPKPAYHAVMEALTKK